ncbi:SMP-30/gluconolactonase/LRE family protein [Prescottella agglutinans]|uniref:SMP-30/gluconolactonase/LRE family protein n=1 Tax=Prescottella agglutinans TaxID=1644129 RepID=A0A438BEK9_9NOCA|nr:SMP-30/gluconolactonase/LRE family protein [Prescottella agglutinans]RVW09440.1 SMP-30/gluconolactonase/LRE family protein [Prescottella agglutinans]
MKTSTAQQLTGVVTHHGEGPVWLNGHGLVVLDMLAGDIVLLDEAGEVSRRINVGPVVAALRPRRGGGFVAGIERGFALLDNDWTVTDTIECWTDPSIRMNDGTCDPDGRFWCGSMSYDLVPGAGALWQLHPDGATTIAASGVGCSNGLAWTQSGNHAYYVDSLTNRIDMITVGSEGNILSRTPFLDTAGLGFPDGLAVDRADGVWLALFDAGRLVHVDRHGRLDAEITVPAGQVTACTFGGPRFDQLYITTSRYQLTEPEQGAGAVYIAEPPIGGFGPFAFRS